MFSGPVLAVCHSRIYPGRVYCGSGPFLRTIEPEGDASVSEKVLSDSVSLHGIVEVQNNLIGFGGREIWCRDRNGKEKRLMSKDWILAATISGELLCAAVMHNRVEVYDISTDFPCLVTTVPCPEHALLYSAEIRVRESTLLEVFGGGVMSSVFFWTISLPDFRVESFMVQREHKGSVFKLRLSDAGDFLLSTSDDRTAKLWSRKTNDSFAVTKSFPGHLARVWDATWIDFQTIATACEDGLIRFFSVKDNNNASSLRCTKTGHEKDVRCLSSRNGVLVSGGEDGCVREWFPDDMEMRKWKLPVNLSTNRWDKSDWIRAIHLVKEGRNQMIVVVTNFGRIFRINHDTLELSQNVFELSNHEPSLREISASAVWGCESLFLGTVDGSVIFFSQNESLRILPEIVPFRVVSLFPLSPFTVIAANHAGDLVSLSFRDSACSVDYRVKSSPGKLLCHLRIGDEHYFGDEKGCVRDFRGRSARVCSEKLTSLHVDGASSEFIANSSNGKSYRISTVNLTATETENLNFVGFAGPDFLVADSQGVQFRYNCGGHRRPFDYLISDEKRKCKFIHATNDEVVCVTGTLSCRVRWQGCHGADLVHQLVINQSGRGIISVNEDNKIRMIDPSFLDNKYCEVIGAHEGSVRAVSAVGKWVLCGGARSQLSLWEITTESLIYCKKWNLSPESDDLRIMGVAGLAKNDPSHVVFLAIDSAARVHRLSVSGEPSFSVETSTYSSISEIEKSVCLSCASDNGSFFVGAGNGTIVHLNDHRKLSVIRPHQSGVNAIAVTKGFIVSVSDDQSIAVSRVSSDGISLTLLFFNPEASLCSIRAVACWDRRVFTTGTDRRVSEWSICVETGNLQLVSNMTKTAVTDPLALCIVPEKSLLVVAGRGIQSIPLVSYFREESSYGIHRNKIFYYCSSPSRHGELLPVWVFVDFVDSVDSVDFVD